MRAETSPVYAPPASVCIFCAPILMPLPCSSRSTSVSHGKGGQTTTSTSDTEPKALTTAPARARASSRFVFIFQLPTTRGTRTVPILTRPIPFGDASDYQKNLLLALRTAIAKKLSLMPLGTWPDVDGADGEAETAIFYFTV